VVLGGAVACNCTSGFMGDQCQTAAQSCPLPAITGRCPDDWRGRRFAGSYLNPTNLTMVPNPGAWGAFVFAGGQPARLQFDGAFLGDGSLSGSAVLGDATSNTFRATCDLSLAAAGIISVDLVWTSVTLPQFILGTRSSPISRATMVEARRVPNPEGRRLLYLFTTFASDPVSYGTQCFRPGISGDGVTMVPANVSASPLFMQEVCPTALNGTCPSTLRGQFSGYSSASGPFVMSLDDQGNFNFNSGQRMLFGRAFCNSSDGARPAALDLVLNDGSSVRGLMNMNLLNRPGVIRVGEQCAALADASVTPRLQCCPISFSARAGGRRRSAWPTASSTWRRTCLSHGK
jgi:hypothetical protein